MTKLISILKSAMIGLTLIAVSASSVFSAYEFYVTIEGTKQGRFKGESVRENHKSKIAAFDFGYSVTSPRDLATGLPSGKRQHKPISITKPFGAASPQIFQALVTNEILKTVYIEFYRTSPEGLEEVYQTIKLSNATVSDITMSTQNITSASSAKTTSATDIKESEKVSFTFQKIEILNIPGRTMSMDEWK